MSLESGRTNIFVIEKCTAPKLSLKIRYNFWDTRYINQEKYGSNGQRKSAFVTCLNISVYISVGYANIAQVVGYKIGMLIGGGFLLWLDDYLSWSFILLGFTIIYTAAGCLLWIHDKYRFVGNEIKDQPDLCRADKSKNEVEQASWTFLEVLQSPGTKQMALLALIYKLGEQCFVTIFPLMLLDNGTSAKFVGSLTGVFGQAFSIFGSTLGGVLLSKWRCVSLCGFNDLCSLT